MSLSDWDESDEEFMDDIGEQVRYISRLYFPPKIYISQENRKLTLKRRLRSNTSIPVNEKNKCFQLIVNNLGTLYTKFNGKKWQSNKKIEMDEHGLVYVQYYLTSDNDKCDKDATSQQLVAFLSFMVTYHEGEKVLYLYEIHINEGYRNLKLGTQLIENFHSLSANLDDQLETEATSLTVFSENEMAVKWYFKLGYKLSEQSPRDKILRGKVKKPVSYWLRRSNSI